MKKIPTLLYLSSLAVAANLLALENYSNVPSLQTCNSSFSISPLDTDSDGSEMRLTDAQYNGIDPINLPLDKKLFIEVSISNLNNLNTNEINISENSSLIYIESRNYASGTFASSGFSGVLTIDMICTPISIASSPTTITVSYAGKVIKEFTITVTDPAGLD